MTHVIAPLDVVNVDRGGDPRHEVQAAQVPGDVRKLLQSIAVALEVREVHRVEAGECRK
jgi:hypothetical protein